MASQVENGKAFEYAVALSFSAASSFELVGEEGKNYFDDLSLQKRSFFLATAKKAAEHILEKEKNIWNNRRGEIRFVNDTKGQDGDVRDIVLVNDNDNGLGISCKTNHSAVKHSRLSGSRDFVKKWGIGDKCSNYYWSAVRPIFSRLNEMKKESNGSALWRDYKDKFDSCYLPILEAFEAEINRLKTQDEEKLCKNCAAYLFGRNDFYKIMASESSKKVQIQGFNFSGSLEIPKMILPSKLIGSESGNGGRFSKTLYFNKGFSLNFRIHNASSRIEPSLKFDITALGLPPSIYQHTIMIEGDI